MDQTAVVCVVLFGLHVLPLSCHDVYHVIKDAKTWSEAQSFCREKYNDLVTINSMEDAVRLGHELRDNNGDEFWIGLYGNFQNFSWSLEREGFYGEGEAEYTNWEPGHPKDVGYNDCTRIHSSGKWSNGPWVFTIPSICYDEFADNKYVHVSTKMSWLDAQLYCRKHHTDLVSVRNESENQRVMSLVSTPTWIGYYRISWLWSDGQPRWITSFTNWDRFLPKQIKDQCVTTTHGKWMHQSCSDQYPFVCSESVKRQVRVNVVLTRSDPFLDLEEMQDDILQQLNEMMREHGLSEQVNLKWTKQPDRKIFHKKRQNHVEKITCS